MRSREWNFEDVSRNVSASYVKYAYHDFRNLSEIAAQLDTAETISRIRALLSRISLRVAGIFADVEQIRSDWNVKEPVSRLRNRDTAALKCIRS